MKSIRESPSHSAVLQARERMLLHHLLSDQLSLAEHIVLTRTFDLTHTQSDLVRASEA